MNRMRIALLGLLVVLVAVWVAYASLPSALRDDGAALRAANAASRPPAAPLFDLDAVSGRLERLRSTAPAPRAAGRNPFEFGATPSRHTAAAAPAAPAAQLPAPTEPARPLLTLSGIVERTEPEGKVRTAVLSGFGQVFFGKPGDTVAARYEIVAVGADAVELRDTVTSQPLRLALR